MRYMKNHFQREIWWIFGWPLLLLVLVIAATVSTFRYAPLRDYIFASFAGLLTSIFVNILVKTFRHAFALSVVIIAIFAIVVSKWFSGLFAGTSFDIIVLSIPSCLITAWVFSKYRLKQMRTNN